MDGSRCESSSESNSESNYNEAMPEAMGPEVTKPRTTKPEATKPENTTSIAPLTFEGGLQQLETIVKEMEGGDLPLERALELFELGMKLSESCRKQLEEAETRIEILTRRAGEIQPQPFAPRANDK
jgi:exodeoxyribonuclease VII small subunit